MNYYNDFEEKNIQVQLPKEQSCGILADAKALERVIENIIGNTLKYGSEYFKIELEKAEGKVSVVFQNPAKNFTEETVKHLFERFYVQEQSRTDGGSGLGLTISKMLVESMGGQMTAELENGCLKLVIKFMAVSVVKS